MDELQDRRNRRVKDSRTEKEIDFMGRSKFRINFNKECTRFDGEKECKKRSIGVLEIILSKPYFEGMERIVKNTITHGKIVSKS
ncbi:MAG: hypothetical protein WEA58_02100 [Balneolaceae bacterium]